MKITQRQREVLQAIKDGATLTVSRFSTSGGVYLSHGGHFTTVNSRTFDALHSAEMIIYSHETQSSNIFTITENGETALL